MKLDKAIHFLKNEHLRFWVCVIYIAVIFLLPDLITPPAALTLIIYLVWSMTGSRITKCDYLIITNSHLDMVGDPPKSAADYDVIQTSGALPSQYNPRERLDLSNLFKKG